MDDEAEGGALPREIRMALAILVIGLVAIGLITLVDVQMKRAIVEQIEQHRKEMDDFGRRGRPGGAAAGPAVPDPMRRVPGRNGDPFDTGAPSPDGQAAAPAVVRPGDESARPPHRGSVNGP
jgi:hypothetical protein